MSGSWITGSVWLKPREVCWLSDCLQGLDHIIEKFHLILQTQWVMFSQDKVNAPKCKTECDQACQEEIPWCRVQYSEDVVSPGKQDLRGPHHSSWLRHNVDQYLISIFNWSRILKLTHFERQEEWAQISNLWQIVVWRHVRNVAAFIEHLKGFFYRQHSVLKLRWINFALTHPSMPWARPVSESNLCGPLNTNSISAPNAFAKTLVLWGMIPSGWLGFHVGTIIGETLRTEALRRCPRRVGRGQWLHFVSFGILKVQDMEYT